MSVLSRLQKRFSYPLLSGQSVGRILRRSLLLLLALMAVILSAFYLTLRTLNQESYLRERYRQSLSLLQQTDRSLQVSLNHLETQSTAFLSSFDVTGVMVRQGQADFDQRYQVVSGLADLPQNSPLVTAAWLYLPQAGSVFCSDQQILLLPDCSPALQTLLTGSESGLFVQQGQLYYKLGYPQNEPLGLLLLQLDTSALYRSTFNQTQSVYIYAQDMTPLFSAACRYPDDAALADTVYQSALSAFYRSADAKSSYYTLYRSVSTGLNYLTIESAVSFLPALQDSLRLLLPCGALILLGTALFSLYSLHSVYRPIQHALDVLVSAPAADAAPLPSEPPRLRQTLSAVAPDVFLLLFRRILYGGMSDPAEIEQSLEGLPPVFPVDAPYLVLRLEAQCEAAAKADELYRRLYILHAKELAGHYWQGKCPLLADENSQGYLLLFVSCQALGTQQALAAAADFEQYLQNETRELPYTPLLGCSTPTEGLQNLPAAFASASQDLSYRRYYQAAALPDAAPAHMADRCRQKTQNILQKALHREKNIAGALAAELCAEPLPPTERAQALRAIHTAVMRQLIDCSIDPADCPFVNPAYADGTAPLAGSEDDLAYIRSLLAGAIDVLYEHGQSSRNQYLADAKEFIAQHYNDASLSLDSVSQHVGISSPYLSSIFSELQGQRFLDYLNRLRVEKATHLLQSTDASISDIGFQTGFYSANTFIRTFKKIMGETPGAYRTRRAVRS